ncbi:mitochondrial carrier [Xylona heveae TC161]|uniref:Mitochondrial carrier n=1 Tax=Xylona heveae (strain CBS 132557 / TC161) TaxID=1328760 RepID=A0A165GKM9_XYLHT|nr:mitochondrial carrier [Xylona heveae TC161]KZF22307.1 mitochondrial carrier [Xylona heveae TC161]
MRPAELENPPQEALLRDHKSLGNAELVTLNKTSATKAWAHFIAGASGGMAAAVFTSPLDVLRTRLQADFYRSPPSIHTSATPMSARTVQLLNSSCNHFHETLSTLSTIRRTEGWRVFFRGLGPSLTGIVPASAIKFHTYGNCKRIVSEATHWGKDEPMVHMLSAAAAGIVTGTATNPLWVIKTRLQLDKPYGKAGGIQQRQYRNSLDCLAQTMRGEGIRGLYRGLSASYLGTIESTLHLVLYEQLKISLAGMESGRSGHGRDDSARGQVQAMVRMSSAAGISKLLAVLVAYPHEVIRTRLRQAPSENGRVKYTGLVQCFRLILKEEGFLSMYGGLTPHLLRTVPAAGIALGVYELVLSLFGMPL